MREIQHRPRKRFGQNFLQNPGIIQNIVQAIAPTPLDHLVEIGPGLGALTNYLLAKVQKLTAIEIDRDLCQHLTAVNKSSHFELINADALSLNYADIGTGYRIVGNLPYNISTPLIIHLLSYTKHIQDMHFMLQKEVVQRLVATPGCKNYGRLSIITQYFCAADYLFDVPPEAFFPQPKVDSAVVRLTPYLKSPFQEIDPKQLQSLVAQAFSMRRKTLANNLKKLISAAELISLGIDPQQRPEQIGIEDYISISKSLSLV